MQETDEFNPFEDHPTKFERYLYDTVQGHSALIIGMHQKIQLIEQMFKEIRNQNEATNRAILNMPQAAKDEKPN